MKQLNQEQIENLPEWMPVEGFPNYELNCRKGLVRNARTFRILKPSPDTHGYPRVDLHKDGKGCGKKVHRLIANAAFGYHNISTAGLLVMHLDEERNDPRIVNLALGSHQENMNFPKAKQRISEAKRGEKHPWYGKHLSAEVKNKISDAQSKKAVGAYQNGVLIMTFQSTADAHRNGFNRGAVSWCCLGKYKSYKGYQWRFLDTTTAMTAS